MKRKLFKGKHPQGGKHTGRNAGRIVSCCNCTKLADHFVSAMINGTPELTDLIFENLHGSVGKDTNLFAAVDKAVLLWADCIKTQAKRKQNASKTQGGNYGRTK